MRPALATAAVALAIATTTATRAHAEAPRPSRWLARATPGLGYAWDRERACDIEGRMFAGGFTGAYEVAPGLFAGLALGLAFNTLPARGCGPDELRLAMAMFAGAQLDWYPLPARGLHVMAGFGYAETQHDVAPEPLGRGIGTIGGVGYDWRTGAASRAGVLAQVSTHRTFTRGAVHATVVPSLLVTISWD